MIIEIHPSTKLRTVQYEKEGRPSTLHKQSAWVFLTDKKGVPSPYPVEFEILVPRDEKGAPIPYQPGRYQIAHSSFFVDKFKGLAIAPRLVPLKA